MLTYGHKSSNLRIPAEASGEARRKQVQAGTFAFVELA